eukprot:483914_1
MVQFTPMVQPFLTETLEQQSTASPTQQTAFGNSQQGNVSPQPDFVDMPQIQQFSSNGNFNTNPPPMVQFTPMAQPLLSENLEQLSTVLPTHTNPPPMMQFTPMVQPLLTENLGQLSTVFPTQQTDFWNSQQGNVSPQPDFMDMPQIKQFSSNGNFHTKWTCLRSNSLRATGISP